MENIFAATTLDFNKFLNYFNNFAYVVSGTSLLLISAVLIVLLLILYKKLRKKFPVSVNCWFCNTNTRVPYEFSNSWDCSHCKQYNGFNEDGGYNKDIKEQYNAKLNEDIFQTLKPCINTSKGQLQTNGFCKLCNINQQLKIQQLALFVPLNENNYFEEIEQYRKKLEKAYQLCSKCEKTLQETLEKQKYILLQNRLNDHKQSSPKEKLQNVTKVNAKEILSEVQRIGISGLKWSAMITSLLLFVALLHEFETENQFLHSLLPDFLNVKSVQPIFKMLCNYIIDINIFSKELSFAGFVCSLLRISERQAKTDHINLLVWGLLHILLWSDLTELKIFMSGVSIFFNSQVVYNKQIYLSKISMPKKYNFQPEKRIFPEVYSFASDKPGGPVVSSTATAQNYAFSPGPNPGDFDELKKHHETYKMKSQKQELNKKKERKKENEFELPPNEDKEGSQGKPDLQPAPTNSSVFSKSFLSTLEEDRNEETSEPLDEVYNNFNGLHLGGKQKKSQKSSNFLFANNNFSEKKSSSSIIKPSKLIKNLSSSWTFTESNESASRSSTPSSGYSSQKPEKIEHNRYDFSKTISPISVNPYGGRHSPRDSFDYCEGGNGFYNGYNYFSPSFVPFQQFPGPMGHTTIYTCTRPTNFPFPFSFPCQGFPSPHKYCPPSPRFSDASECENLFQNTSKSFESSKKWFRVKTISYYFSIFLNLVTLLGLFYFVSAGIISVDWNLPKLNFFV